MGLIKFACLMVKNNKTKYTAYLLSVAISVAFVFINFNLLFNESLYSVSGSSVMMGLVVMISIIVFVNFANSYFLKSRTKEMAIVAIGGRSVYEIASIIFVENLIILLIGSIAGLVLAFGIIIITFPWLFDLMGISNGNFIDPAAIVVVIMVIIVIFIQVMILSLGYFIRKEVREIILEDKDGNKMYKKYFEYKMLVYLILYLTPFMCFLLPVEIKDIGQYISLISILSIYGGYGMVKYTLPWILCRLKERFFKDDKVKFISISNIENSLFRMGNQVIFLISITISTLFLYTFNIESKAYELSTIIAFGIIQVIIGISFIYNIISDSFKKIKSFKQLLLVGYLKKEIMKTIKFEVIILFLIILIICGMPSILITAVNMMSGLYTSYFGNAIIFEVVITPIVLMIINYLGYKKIIMNGIGRV
ncbi:MAG: FtsX-like permease family protein [Clostridium sp.]